MIGYFFKSISMKYGSCLKVTSKTIFDQISQEEIMEKYLGIIINLDKSYTNPFRKDNSPGCKFYYNDGNKLRFRDFATGFDEDCFGIVCYATGLNYGQALDRILSDFGKTKNNSSLPSIRNHSLTEKGNKARGKIIVKKRNYNKIDANYWKSQKITSDNLKLFNVIAVERAWIKYDDDMKEIYSYHSNDICYAYIFPDKTIKLYFPLRDKYRFVNNSSYIQGYNMLPEKGKYVLITKSYKDVITLYNFNIPAIAPQSESNNISDELINDLSSRFEYIFILYDWDRAGVRSAVKITNQFYDIIPLFLTKAGFVKVKINYQCKDITEYRSMFNDEKIYKLIDQVKSKYIK